MYQGVTIFFKSLICPPECKRGLCGWASEGTHLFSYMMRFFTPFPQGLHKSVQNDNDDNPATMITMSTLQQ